MTDYFPLRSEEKTSITWATRKDTKALCPLFNALYKQSIPEASSISRYQTLKHIKRLLNPTTPHRLVIAWSKNGDAIGLAAIATFVSVDTP